MSRDKKGRPVKDDAGMQQEMATAGLGMDQGYEPYVFYEFELV
jgi:V-type H+-transporting ATPase subunit C